MTSRNRIVNPSASNSPGFSASLPVSGANGWRVVPRSLRWKGGAARIAVRLPS
jgi:hypothetical protein